GSVPALITMYRARSVAAPAAGGIVPPPRRANPFHRRIVQLIAGQDIFAGPRPEFRDGDDRLLVGDQDPAPDLAILRILGAAVDAAIGVPVEWHVRAGADRQAAAPRDQVADIGAGEAVRSRLAFARFGLRVGHGRQARPGDEGDDREDQQ